MEIKSSLLNSEDFKFVKESLIYVSEQDGKEKFRVKMLEYINDSADNDEDEFFFDMLDHVRFLDPTSNAVAYTTPDTLIYLNAPKDHENVRIWDFVYDHECMHQIWDTFGVGDKIQKEGIEYNHYVLNIASDCVINDYLIYYRKKTPYPNGITPEYLKDTYGIDYDRKKDTQFTLYIKLLEKAKELEKDKNLQDQCKEFDGTIKPKSINKQNGGGGGPQGGGQNHSKDYIKGWTDAIQDTLDKKIDPLKDKPKNTGNKEYDQGYSDAIDKIKEGLENGVTMGSSSGGGNAPKSDLPEIPWEKEPDGPQKTSSGSGSSGNSGNSKDNKNSDDSNKDPDEKAQDAADKAKEAAAQAQSAANKAKEDANKSDSSGDSGEGSDTDDKNGSGKSDKDKQQAAKDAQDAANKAKAAAKKAQDAADKAKDAMSKGDKKGAEKAAKEAQNAADEAQQAANEANKGNQDGNSQNSKGNGKGGTGNGGALMETEEDLKKIRESGKQIIEKYRNKISGSIGNFIKQCTMSVNLKKSGLMTDGTRKGASVAWNQQMNTYIKAYVKNKVFQKQREFKRTYQKVKRGSGFVEYGSPIQRGKKLKNDKLLINVAFYVDRSGSMGSAIDNVFKALYYIAEALKKQFGKEKVVSDVEFRIYAFDTSIQEIAYGKKATASGGTMPFHQLLKNIGEKTKDYLINVILTDAEFDINSTEVDRFIKDIDGCILFVTNTENGTMKKLSEKYKTQLFYIKADSNFTIG